ncbi:MAG: hypothetical protein WBQ78_01530, partial [Gammaproteobacteria bacterium]
MPTSQSKIVLRAFTRIHRWLPVLILITALGGCGGDGVVPDGVAASSATSNTTSSITNISSGGSTSSTSSTPSVTISGSVGDGPVTGATVTVYDKRGAVLGTVISDSAASYRKTLQVDGRRYPLRLVASGGIDLVTGHAPDFKMVSVMQRATDRTVNINPFSTLIVNTAERMSGGLTGANVNRARNIVLDQLGFGLDTSAVPDPVTTRVTTGNVAHIVKASEALGEMVRRTRDHIAATGKPASGSGVVSALAADLVDGFVDGLGASGTDATISAVANVVSAQVLVEAMSNSLRVEGTIASNVIDQSIKSTQSGVSNAQLSGNVRINNQMIRQAGVALKAVQVLDSRTAIRTIVQQVAGLSANSTASSVARVLPVSTTSALYSATGMVASAARADITQINQAVFAQADT